jgi:hypothetical protein
MMQMRREQLRMVMLGVVLVVLVVIGVIGVASIVEPPGIVAGLGYAVVLVTIVVAVVRERRARR